METLRELEGLLSRKGRVRDLWVGIQRLGGIIKKP